MEIPLLKIQLFLNGLLRDWGAKKGQLLWLKLGTGLERFVEAIIGLYFFSFLEVLQNQIRPVLMKFEVFLDSR